MSFEFLLLAIVVSGTVGFALGFAISQDVELKARPNPRISRRYYQ